jgi:hypothetical protein
VYVPVMEVGVVRMAVGEPLVGMPVRLRFRAVLRQFVGMPVMLVVHVRVLDLRRTDVLVLVSFGYVQPNPRPHQRTGHPEPLVGPLT